MYDSATKFLKKPNGNNLDDDEEDDKDCNDEEDDDEVGDNECSLLSIAEKEIAGSVSMSRNSIRARVSLHKTDEGLTASEELNGIQMDPECLMEMVSDLYEDAYESLERDLNSRAKRMFECGSLTMRLTRAGGSCKHCVYAATCPKV